MAVFGLLASQAGVPKHVAAARTIRRALIEGRLRQGDRLPGQQPLATQLGVAALTVRRAVDSLVEEGLLERRARSGTYVRGRVRAPNACLVEFHVAGMREGGTLASWTLEVVRQEMADAGGQTRALILPTPLPPPNQVARELRAMKIGAIGVLGHRNCDASFVRVLARQFAAVLFYKGLPSVALPCVRCDVGEAARLMVDYFARRGRRRIGMAPVDMLHDEAAQLSCAVQNELVRRKLPVDKRFWFEHAVERLDGRATVDRVMHWLDELFSDADSPDAMVLLRGWEAEHVRRLLAAAGRSLGDDVDVIVVDALLQRDPYPSRPWPLLDKNYLALAQAGGRLLRGILTGETVPNAPTVVSRPELLMPAPETHERTVPGYPGLRGS